MKSKTLKTLLIICLFGVISCKKDNPGNIGPANNHQTTNCQIATFKGANGGDLFFHYNASYQLVSNTYYYNNKQVDSEVFFYNNAGQLTNTDIYNPGYSFPLGSATFQYNSAGRLVQFSQFNGLPNPRTIDNYIYNSNGNIVIDSTYDDSSGTPTLDSVSNFTYDAYGNMTDVKTYNNKGILEDHTTIAYDNETSLYNNLPLAFRIDYFGGTIAYCSNYNNITTITTYGTRTTGQIFGPFAFTYNNQGLPTSEAVNGQPSENTTFTYTCH